MLSTTSEALGVAGALVDLIRRGHLEAARSAWESASDNDQWALLWVLATTAAAGFAQWQAEEQARGAPGPGQYL